jgi:hypothetical protein
VDLTFVVLVVLSVVFVARLQHEASRRVGALRETVKAAEPGAFEDRLQRSEIIFEADELLLLTRVHGPRLARLGLLISFVYLLLNVSGVREELVQWGLGTCFSLGTLGYAYTRAGFRRNETELREVRHEIRGATRTSDKKLV